MAACYEIRKTAGDGKYFFVLMDKEGDCVHVSGTFEKKLEMVEKLKLFREAAGNAPVIDISERRK